ncbi:MAG: formylglycine-generating enzyme family protein [Chitinivibrionia bacterium]|nr:formylglycine-generating enzyme family protein [Chitinivibrionia bacterium]
MKNYFLKAFFATFLFIAAALCQDENENENEEEVDTTAKVIENKNRREGDTIINGIEFVLVKAGTFMMGSPKDESGRHFDEAQYQVAITQNYRISRYPITQAQYREITGSRPSYFGENDDNPVEFITWEKANEFAKTIADGRGRLPTEAEWEFAARGANASRGLIYSGSDELDEVGWYADNILSDTTHRTQAVGQKQANVLGIHDMSGNVWEWCSDWYGLYPKGVSINPAGADSGIERVVRGGAWDSNKLSCRLANRGSCYPSSGYNNVGIRVVVPVN